MKKVISMILVIALTAAVTVGGTLAYLTVDAGTKTNTFKVGGIDVELTEEVGVTTNGGGAVTSDEEGADYTGLMPGDRITKKVTIANTGADDAYVRVTVKLNNANEINKAIDEVYGDDAAQAKYDEIFAGWGLKHTKDLDGDGTDDAGMRLTITGEDMPAYVMQVDSVKTIDEYALFYSGNWFGDSEDIIPFDEYYTADMGTYELKYTYYMLLPAGESTTLFEGLNIPADFNADQLAMFDGLTIDVDADAIQAANIPVDAQYINDVDGKAKTAFALLKGDITPVSEPAVAVASSEELVAALDAGDNVRLTDDVEVKAEASSGYGKTALNVLAGQTIDGNGKELTTTGAVTTWDSAINTTGGTIKNLTVSSGFRGIFINHNGTEASRVILENVTVDGPVYTISCDQGTGNGLTARDCTLNGWTSYAATLGDAVFIDCSFGEGAGYAFCRPFAPTTFVNCDFEAGYEIDPRAAVTFENCTIGGVLLTAENLSTLVTSNIANATVK